MTISASSYYGHMPPLCPFGMYCATKHAITTLTEALRQELAKQKSKIRVTVSTGPSALASDLT
jgi:hypothetical protein